VNLVEAAAQAQELAERGAEQELAQLRMQWADEVEGAARHGDYRVRALAYRAVGQFRYRQKLELLRRGLEDESPAARGSALLSVELLSRDAPGVVNSVRPVLHEMSNSDPNNAVRRLAIAALKNGSPQRETIVLLSGIAEEDDQDRDVRNAARTVAAVLTKKSRAR
jgi:HEAT repeat protein